MPTREGTFYGIWPVLDGKPLNLQWGQIRSNQAELKAIARNSLQELETGVDELNALRALVGQAYGDLDFRNKYRFFYDGTTKEMCCQKNDGTVDTPIWTDAWCVRFTDGQFQVVSTGGIQSTAGFYGPGLVSIEEVGESGTSANSTIRRPTKIFFNADDGFGVDPISSGANKGSPEITFTQPFGKAQSFSKAGKAWVVNHDFGVSPVMVQVMDADDRVVIPDKADISDPNTAYFYFNAPFTGSVYIASGGLGAASLLPRDPFYLSIRIDSDPSSPDNTLKPNADLVFDAEYFYINVDLDEDAGGAHKKALISLTDKIMSPFKHDVTFNKYVRMDDSLSVENSVTAEAFYLTPGSGGEISKSGNDLFIKAHTGQIVLDSNVTASGTIAAEAFYTTEGEVASLTVKESDGSPSVANVKTIVVSNLSLTDDGDGQVTLDFASAEVGARFNTVTAEGFYVQSGGELSPDGMLTVSGTAAKPGVSFKDDPDTGLYRSAANELSMAVGGNQIVKVAASLVTLSKDIDLGGNDLTGVGVITGDNHVEGSLTAEAFYVKDGGELSSAGLEVASGTVAAPSLSFVADDDTGIYRPGANTLAIATGGANIAEFRKDSLRLPGIVEAEAFYLTEGGSISSSGDVMSLTADQIVVPDGTSSVTGLRHESMAATDGIHYGSGVWRFRVSNTQVLALINSSIVCGKTLDVVSGSVSTPGIRFTGDTDTGIYRPGDNTVAIATGGTTIAEFRPDSARFTGIVEAEAFYLTTGGEAKAETSIDHTAITNIGTNAHTAIDTHIADASKHFTEGSIDHTAITNIGTNAHTAIDTHIADATKHFTEGSINHTAITNIGTNSHSAIDTHIADATKHFTEGSIDHGLITGLGDDDHTIYIKADGTRAFTGDVDFGGKNLTGIGLITGDNHFEGSVTAEAFYTKDGGAVAGAITVKEVDGAPDVSGVTTIRVSNGTLTDDGSGQVTITTGGGGGGSARFNDVTAEGFYVQGGGELGPAGLEVADGTAAAPSISFVDDDDTGIHRPASNTLAISTGGANIATFRPDSMRLAGIVEAEAFYLVGGGEITATPIVLGGDALVSQVILSKTGDQTLTSGNGADITWNVTKSDPDDWHNEGGDTTAFTVPSGLGITHVRITSAIQWESIAAGRRGTRITKNTGFTFEGIIRQNFSNQDAGAATSQFQITSFPIAAATAGDVFRINCSQDSGGDLKVKDGDSTWVQIEGIASGSGRKGNFNNVTAEGFYVQSGGELSPDGMLTVDGTSSKPAMSFVGDTNTGIYSSGTNELSISANGTQVASFGLGGIRAGNGSANTPSISFINDADSGIYREGANSLGITAAGTRIATFRPDSVRVSGVVEAESFYFTTGGEAPQSYVQSFSAALEWQVGHNLNRQHFIAQAYKGIGTLVIPDTIDVSDPNTAYFYFAIAQDGKAVILGIG